MRRFLSCAFALCAVLALAGASGATPARSRIDLAPLNGSGETGTATLVQRADGSLLVSVTTRHGGTAPQPLHIHQGTCADSGRLVYPLQTVINGTSQTTLKGVKLADLASSPSVINVHKSMHEMGTYTACGLIKT